MTRPAENQQTVEALAAKIEQGMSSYMLAPDGAVCLNTNYNAARAALRDLVAQADELRRTVEWYAERRNYMPPAGKHGDGLVEQWIFEHDGFDGEGPGARARAALARLDGAR